MNNPVVRMSGVQLIPISKLKPHPKNPNKHPKDQIARLADVIEYQGWRYPVKVSNRSGFVTAGHGRIEAARLKGWQEVPVDFQDYDSEEQEYADVVADNAIASWAELDLSSINTEVPGLGPDFDIDLLGIKGFEIEVADKEPGASDDEIPEQVETVCKPGDIWKLGEHRLMCGDSTLITHVEALMEDQKADMVFTDPPWNVNYGGGNASEGGWRKDQRKILNDHMDPEAWAEFLQGASCALQFCTKPGAPLYCVMSAQEWPSIHKALQEAGFHWSSTIIWAKDRLVLSRKDYHTQYEPIWYGWLEGAARLKELEDRKQTDLWQFDRPHKSELHPTTKPVELIERAIENSSNKRNIVVDLFGGSGSTLIACHKLHRRCFAMELDPKYCDVIVARWEKYAGEKAERLVEGPEENEPPKAS